MGNRLLMDGTGSRCGDRGEETRTLDMYLMTLSTVLDISTFHCFYQCLDRKQRVDMRFKMTCPASNVGPNQQDEI